MTTTTTKDPDVAWITQNRASLVVDHSGLSMYQLQILFKVTGSKAVARTYRTRMNAIGPFGRDEHGIVQ